MERGQYIDGRYKIIRPIGSGGTATVYLAEDLILERQVAIKMMHHDFANDESNMRRFQREVNASTNLSHPNIVSVYDINDDDRPCIVMEYVDGTDLKEYIVTNYPIPLKKVVDIMFQVLSAVDYAHRNNVIHRDLKPQNILIDKDGTAKITDFGIAIALSKNSITQTNSVLGSVQYISPEQARGSLAVQQSDIYSLGIILYEMLTGQVPYDGESAVSVALKHFQEDMPSVREVDSSIPQSLENVVLKATAKSPHARYQSVAEMKADLETALNPERRHEAVFIPRADELEETIQLDQAKMLDDHIETKPIPSVKRPSPEPEASQVKKPEKSNDKQPDEPQKKKRRPWWLLILALLLIAGIVFAFLNTGGSDTKVPNLVGLSQEDAAQELEDLNLLVDEVVEEPHENIQSGLVTRTDPERGSLVKEGSAIKLFISSGKETIPIPDVIGASADEAQKTLEDLGFSVDLIQENSDTVPEGSVIAQSVEPDTEVVPSETDVELTISAGPSGFALRDLTNYSLQGVLDYAQENNLTVDSTEESHSSVPVGQVIRQSPRAGTTVYPGGEIEVVISSGPEEEEEESEETESSGRQNVTVNVQIPYQEPAAPETSEEEEASSQSSPASNTIRIFVDDAVHSFDTPVREFTITGNTSIQINLELEAGQTGRYRVERDGTIIDESTVTL